jgi:Uma2 family endonuclease
MTWAEICEDKRLQNLPFRIESDRWGNIVMSPPARSRHGEYQLEIGALLRDLLTMGLAITECPIQTAEGVKAADAAWVSHERRASKPNDPCYLIAPEICVEVMSPSNSMDELMERKRLYFEKGALEFWLCDGKGGITFWDAAGVIAKSNLCPEFPNRIEV